MVLKVVQQNGRENLGLSDNTYTKLVTLMLQSRFCFQPMGDTPSRKGIVDSILLGCIPVLFSINQTRLWPWNLPNLPNISVMLDIKKGSPIDQLKQIDEARVTQLRKGVADAAKSLAYTIQDGTGDPVETTLYHAWIHSRGEEKPTIHSRGEEKPPELYDSWTVIVVCVCCILIGAVCVCSIVMNVGTRERNLSRSTEDEQHGLLSSCECSRMENCECATNLKCEWRERNGTTEQLLGNRQET